MTADGAFVVLRRWWLWGWVGQWGLRLIWGEKSNVLNASLLLQDCSQNISGQRHTSQQLLRWSSTKLPERICLFGVGCECHRLSIKNEVQVSVRTSGSCSGRFGWTLQCFAMMTETFEQQIALYQRATAIKTQNNYLHRNFTFVTATSALQWCFILKAESLVDSPTFNRFNDDFGELLVEAFKQLSKAPKVNLRNPLQITKPFMTQSKGFPAFNTESLEIPRNATTIKLFKPQSSPTKPSHTSRAVSNPPKPKTNNIFNSFFSSPLFLICLNLPNAFNFPLSSRLRSAWTTLNASSNRVS